MAPRVGLEPTTLRLQGFPLLPKGSDYLITRPEWLRRGCRALMGLIG